MNVGQKSTSTSISSRRNFADPSQFNRLSMRQVKVPKPTVPKKRSPDASKKPPMDRIPESLDTHKDGWTEITEERRAYSIITPN